VYDVTIHNFNLAVGGNNNEGDTMIKAGLTLHRFANEAAFGKLEEELFEMDPDGYSGRVSQPISFEECPWAVDNADNRHRNDVIDLVLNDTQSGVVAHHEITAEEQGLYILYYSVCYTKTHEDDATRNKNKKKSAVSIKSSISLDLSMYNMEGGNTSYLTAGDMPLPKMYLVFALLYSGCFYVWFRFLQQRGSSSSSSVKQIHHLMSVLCIVKAVTLFSESARYHYIRISGSAEVWTTIYYCFEFLKGTMLFTVILLLGSGWSFLKPYLNQREKKLIFAILLLQVLNNIAILVVSHHMQGEPLYNKWTSILHLVDILCCAAVLFPIVWQVATLEEQTDVANTGSENDDDHGRTTLTPATSSSEEVSSSDPTTQRAVTKLKLFRSFYITVVAYIYFTRIIIYLFASILDYHQTWLRHCVVEFGTLIFYIYTGYTFRPTDDRASYVELQQRDKDDDVQVVEEGDFVNSRVNDKKMKKMVAEI